jgi:hypothetical protein
VISTVAREIVTPQQISTVTKAIPESASIKQRVCLYPFLSDRLSSSDSGRAMSGF